MILPLQVPAFFAALATIAILGEQFFSQIGGVSDTSNYSAAGVLGAIIFGDITCGAAAGEKGSVQ